MRLAVVGNPENRRVALFLAAAGRAGLPAPEVFPWRDVLLSGRVPGPGTLVRIDSPGENAEVEQLLRALGRPVSAGADIAGAAAVEAVAHGEIAGAAAVFAGLGITLERVAAGGGVLLNQPADILTMTAKPRCHALLTAAGIPLPPALHADGTTTGAGRDLGLGPGVRDYESLRMAMETAGWSRVFVKAAYGSSASGVLALAVGGRRGTAAGRRIMAVTSVELSEGKIFNNLRVRRYDDENSIAAIVDRLGPDGLHVERWYPKAALGGRVLDLRVVVIAGQARHVVVRTSRSPMTNLHLGNERGDVAAVRAAAGERSWAAAMDTCVRAAACFPRTLHAGVDLMFRAGWRDHAVAEVNAFGDLLPRVLSEDGQDTYDAQIAAVRNMLSNASA
ncbi:STM4014 family protein [Actinoplanes sp. HUAS TT8]|uniref:STM4014 family protein n=1 Tax=Actinoplanes sp. HUAS TT8 TaxID=3447453 RepID=UPI003F51D4B0